jgi:hypothetical protein
MDTIFKGASRRLDDLDRPRLGARIGVGEDEIHALLDVETSGHGFDAQGRADHPVRAARILPQPVGDGAGASCRGWPCLSTGGEKPYPQDRYSPLKAAYRDRRDRRAQIGVVGSQPGSRS